MHNYLQTRPGSNVQTSFPQRFKHILWLSFLVLPGCSRFHHDPPQHVYVAARQVYMHDRVAAVSNRVAQVTNGEALELVERGKRFVKVKTPKGEIGWLEEHSVIDDKLYSQFQQLTQKHSEDPVVAVAELRDDLYLHIQPGRESPHFLLIPGNTKVQLLERGSVEKTAAPGFNLTFKPKPPLAKAPASAKPGLPSPPASAANPAQNQSTPTTPSLEDWWLVRDNKGHTGWLLANRLDVDVPDEVGAYAEGQRMVGAYPIAQIFDQDPNHEHPGHGSKTKAGNGKTPSSREASTQSTDAAPTTNQSAPKMFTEYVTVLTPPHGGLPYDFDQIRVFTWSLNHHRYETAFRLHGIHGYLPVKISHESLNGQSEPVFTFQIADSPKVIVDAETGVTRPVSARTLSFRLEGNMVKRTGSDLAPIVLTHNLDEAAKKKKEKNPRSSAR